MQKHFNWNLIKKTTIALQRHKEENYSSETKSENKWERKVIKLEVIHLTTATYENFIWRKVLNQMSVMTLNYENSPNWLRKDSPRLEVKNSSVKRV
jgi:hypothetical protein